MLRQLVNTGYDADRRNGNMPLRNAHFTVQQQDALHHLLQVPQGLTHAHVYHVADALSCGLLDGEYLVDHLAGGEIAAEAHLSSSTEATPRRAPDLRGDTYRNAVFIGQIHRFHLFAISQHKQVLHSAVRGMLGASDFQPFEGQYVRHSIPQTLRKVGHLLVGVRALAVHPFGYLLGAVVRLP